MKLSVIVPIAPSEIVETEFLDNLKILHAGSELIFVSENTGIHDNLKISIPGVDIRFLTSDPGRANCLNTGALNSSGDSLWFLHADSRFNEMNISSLLDSIERYPGALLYFDLAFYNAPILMKLNEWGALFRCRILDTPFGDQGLYISKNIFNSLGGFPEYAAYGEDHLFVRNARRKHIPVKPVKTSLYTSPRKYIENGWLKTTLLHLYLWQKQIYIDNKKHSNRQNAI